VPPQAVEIEQAMLGAMLLDNAAIGRSAAFVRVEGFYHVAHGTIFAAMRALYEDGKPVDPLTLAEALRRRDQLDEVGGVVYLAQLAAEVATAANIDYHSQIVADKALSRYLIQETTQVVDALYRGELSGKDAADLLVQKAAQSQVERSELQHIEPVLDEALSEIERMAQKGTGMVGATTGYFDLDEATAGFEPGETWILAARPGVGKTSLGLSMAEAVAEKEPAAVFSQEMPKRHLAQRRVAATARVDLHRLRKGQLREEEWMQIARILSRLASFKLYLDFTPGLSLVEMRSKLRQLQSRVGQIGLVVIDYIQLMSPPPNCRSREEEVSSLSRGLKKIAGDFNVPVLILAQLSRKTEGRIDRRPQLEDLRESGSLENDATGVLFIYRPELYGIKGPNGESLEGLAEIIIGKHRNGPPTSVYLTFLKEYAYFENLAPEFLLPEGLAA